MSASSLKLQNIGQIKSIQLPPGWIAVQHEDGAGFGAIGARYLYSFCDPEAKDRQICLFYRGLPLSIDETLVFRSYLSDADCVLFSGRCDDSAEWALKQLRHILGNAGNNQVVNKEEGWRGPNFHVRQLDVSTVTENFVLSMHGYYCDPEKNARYDEYWSLLFDGAPNASESPVQELFLRAPDKKQLEEASPLFQGVIDSIEWVLPKALRRKVSIKEECDAEDARDHIHLFKSIFHKELSDEEEKPSPNQRKIEALRKQLLFLHGEMFDVVPENTDLIDKANYVYLPLVNSYLKSKSEE